MHTDTSKYRNGDVDKLLCSLGADVDGDGYSANSDCNDLDPLIHPGAAERCNGLDDNCDGTNSIDEVILTFLVTTSQD